MKQYYAKPDTWFKEGTECFREEEMWPDGSLAECGTNTKHGSAIYRGIYIVGSCNPDGYDKFWYNQGHKNGDEVEMRECCLDTEFDIVKNEDK